MDQDKELNLVSDVKTALAALEPEVQQRNLYMNRRDWYTYGDGLWENLTIEDGFDRTLFNFLSRVVDVHTSQLMGRGFQVYSYYEKDDISVFPEGDPQLEAAKLVNKRKKADADARKRFIDAIIRDNGGMEIFKHGARLGSVYGTTVYKMWWDSKKKQIRISLLESPQNYRAGWSSTNFRERDYDAYVYRISLSEADREYGQYLKDGEHFEFSNTGDPLAVSSQMMTSDPLDQNRTNASLQAQTYRPMVTVIDFTGYLDKWTVKNGELVPCKAGEEKRFSAMIVGGKVCNIITDENRLPRYYVVNNRQIPRRAWGQSDLPDSALEINATYIERMSDYITLVNKTLFPMIMAKGFEPSSVPKKKQRKMSVVPMGVEQSLEAVNLPQQFGFEYDKLLNELKESFVRVTGISRLLFDDPQVDANSNQALMTTLKGVIDIVEDKQTRWAPAMVDMFTDALELAARFNPEIRDAIPEDEYWYLYIVWPNVLRKEDATYQTMYNNRIMAGTISLDTYLEAMGHEDISEEIVRIKDNMADPILSAILGKTLQAVATMALQKTMMPAMPMDPNAQGGGGVASPQLTPDQNTGVQSPSMPGSGAPAVSPQGALNQQNQNLGG